MSKHAAYLTVSGYSPLNTDQNSKTVAVLKVSFRFLSAYIDKLLEFSEW
jgi:hypothetical protein